MRKAIFIFFFILCSSVARADCERNFVYAENKFGIPSGYLRAIALTEVGLGETGKLRSWSLNIEGNSLYFRDKSDALRYLSRLDIENIDIGCMQINKYWHQNNFVSSKEMMDPFHNIMYAAYFLKSQYKKTKSWKQSIKNFHSKNPKHNKKYFKKVSRYIGKY